MKKERILMIVPEPFLKPRGTPISVYGRTRALSRLGHRIDMVTYHIGDPVALENVEIHRIPAIPFIREIPIGPSIQKIFLDFSLALKTLSLLLTRDYDIIHSHEEGAFWGTLYARLFGKKHIYDMHSSLPQQFENFHYANFSLVRGIFRWLERFVIRQSDGVIYICKELKSTIDSIDPKKPSVLIENFGAEEGFSGSGLPSSELDGCNGKFTLLYAGTLEKYQGIDLLLRSMSHLRDTELLLLIVGGDANQIEKYRSMATDLGIDDKVRFVGNVSPQDVEAYYRQADALVSTRIKGTNTPLKIYKYLMSGKPVVATRIWSHTQVLSDDIAVLVDVDEKDIAEKLRMIVTHRDFLEKIRENARVFVEKNYSYNTYLNLTRQVYERI